MNIVLWVFQVFLALHTVMGAVWKISNSEQTVPSLAAISHGTWQALSVFELLCALGLVLPLLLKRLGKLVPIAAFGIVAEMLLFCGLHFSAGSTEYGEVAYWLVVAAVSGCIGYCRLKVKPI
ncbi:MAG: DoxX family protein [Oligoflexales bacterium]